MTNSVLIVEDDIEIAHLLSLTITKIGLHTTMVYSGQEAKTLLANKHYDIILLDLMLPEITGEDLVEYIRNELQSNIKIIVISAKTDVDEKVKLLSNGANDYMTKPFDTKELTARVKVQLRALENINDTQINEWRDIYLDKTKRIVKFQQQPLELTNSEYDILCLLMESPEKPLSKKQIYEEIQGMYLGDDNTISVHISNIRRKLKQHTDETYIKTVWGIGFMLV